MTRSHSGLNSPSRVELVENRDFRKLFSIRKSARRRFYVCSILCYSALLCYFSGLSDVVVVVIGSEMRLSRCPFGAVVRNGSDTRAVSQKSKKLHLVERRRDVSTGWRLVSAVMARYSELSFSEM